MKRLKLFMIIYLMLIWAIIDAHAQVKKDQCYFTLNGSDNYSDYELALEVFNEYIEKVKEIPIEGIKKDECLYQIDVKYNKNKIILFEHRMKRISVGYIFKEALFNLLDIRINIIFSINKGFSYKLTNDDEFNIFIISSRDLYVYLINIDSSEKISILFPTVEVKNPILKGKTYVIPSIKSRKTLVIKDISKEKIYLVFSKYEIKNLSYIFNPLSIISNNIFVKEIL